MLAIWIALYLVVLSFGVSKVSNFIYPVMPAAYLLLPAVVEEIWHRGRPSIILAGAMTAIASANATRL